MADKKSDLRVVRTRNALRVAFEELIAETTLDKITVKALTDRAGINRKTFYLHYETIEAFYDEIMNGIMDEFFEYYEKTPDDPWDMDGHARRFFRYLAAQPPMIEQLVCSPSFYDFRRAHLCHPDEPLPSLCRRAVLARGDHARERRTDIYARLFATWPWNATANGCARERSFPWKRRPRFSAP